MVCTVKYIHIVYAGICFPTFSVQRVLSQIYHKLYLVPGTVLLLPTFTSFYLIIRWFIRLSVQLFVVFFVSLTAFYLFISISVIYGIRWPHLLFLLLILHLPVHQIYSPVFIQFFNFII